MPVVLDGPGLSAESWLSLRTDRCQPGSRRFEELKRISGQTFTPTLVWNNLVLSDFGLEDLAEFLEAHNIKQ